MSKSRTRFFWSESASREIVIPEHNKLLRFVLHKYVAGQWSGHFSTNHPDEIAAIQKVMASSRGILREISPKEFAQLTGRPEPAEDEWKVEDHLRDEAEINRLESTTEKCFRDGRIIHCTERHQPQSDGALRRVGNAVQSWLTLYATGEVVPCHVWPPYTRSAKALGDAIDLPFLKDVLAAGLKKSTSEKDIILMTNDDTILHPDTATAIFTMTVKVPAVCSGRVNFDQGGGANLSGTAIKPNAGWEGDIGRDLFAFRKAWLVQNWDSIPDFVLGEPEWDLILSALIRLKVVGERTTDASRHKRDPRYELSVGYVAHEDHEREWRNMARFGTPAKVHNMKLARAFYSQHKMKELAVR